jgi:hypothetical protein
VLGHGLASLMLVYLKPASPGADLSLGISGAGPWFGLSHTNVVYLKPASPEADLSLGISGAGPWFGLSHTSIPEAGLAWSRSVSWDIRCWAMVWPLSYKHT